MIPKQTMEWRKGYMRNKGRRTGQQIRRQHPTVQPRQFRGIFLQTTTSCLNENRGTTLEQQVIQIRLQTKY